VVEDIYVQWYQGELQAPRGQEIVIEESQTYTLLPQLYKYIIDALFGRTQISERKKNKFIIDTVVISVSSLSKGAE
jgi:hypothetical protein